ncbi:Serine/threonine-protein phosphatase 2A regulatory subunit B'' subunit beta [Polyplax serrata]|uniref:Serine/threonine-protein phosphatase 2A regulatory subunit B'' subunit beta n=1 Tax=Polyplax serrata TaxID=468196 RepID=A0AAN8XPR3_POLSC
MVNALKARTRKGCYACEFYRSQEELGLGQDSQPKFPYVPPKYRLPRSYNKTYTKEKENQRPSQPLHTTLQRQAKANKNVFIPRFYFPQGKPQAQQQTDTVLQKLASDFRTFPMGQVPQEKFHIIVKTCECPLYWKVPLFVAAGGEKLGYVDAHSFLDYWKQLETTCHDPAAKFMKILTRNETRNFLLPEDFIPLIQDVVDTHPGLVFLKEANEFHSRYIHTVIARIFYCVNRSWSGRITLPELRRSNLLQIISLLEEEGDINQITQYFSYEHFYVIYCKFWELDRDHDLFIDRQDLTRHNDHALSSRIIDRIFSGAVMRGNSNKTNEDKMSYTEFVWFLLSEEDKQHPTAIEYWFRCMDLDGDGYLSMYELEYFYEEQLQRMELLGIATLPFEDCLCQMLDMIHPQCEGKISLADLKRCKMVTIFFDTFFNLEKYLDHEQRDPFASQRDHDAEGEMSDWDRFAAEEYEILVAEEEGNDNGDELSYDSDGMSDEVPSLERLIKTFEGVERIQLPCSSNPQIITVNSNVSLSKIFRTEENGDLFDGTWSTTPKIKLSKCEVGSLTPEMDNCFASV